MKIGAKQGPRLFQKRTLILTSSIIALTLIFCFIFNVGNIRQAFASGTTYYAIDDGNWEDVNIWSTSGYSGKAAGSFPQAGDYVYIKKHAINVQNKDMACTTLTLQDDQSNLNISNGRTLSVSGDMIISATGGSDKTGINITSKGSKLNIDGNFKIEKSGGSSEISINVRSTASINVTNTIAINYIGGSGGLNLNVMDTAQVNITKGDLSMANPSGTNGINVTLTYKAQMSTNNIYYNSKGAKVINVALYNSAVINLTGNIERLDKGATNGTLSCQNTSAVNFKGTSPQALKASSGGDTIYMQNFNVSNSSSTSPQVTLQSNLYVSGTLSLSKGIMQTSSSARLVLGANATITGGSADCYIHGPIEKQSATTAMTFPVGKSGRYAPVSISAPSSGSSFVVEYYPTPYSDTKNTDGTVGGVSKTEYWDIKRTSGTGTTNITLAWNDAKWSGITKTASLKVAHYNTTTKKWESVGQKSVSATSTAGTITSTTVSSFSPFTFGTEGTLNPLPVSLASYNVAKEGNTVKMSWTTATEINNDYFTVERSSNGQEFTALERVKGHGNSNALLSYEYTDIHPLPGTSYYRLKQTDFNGKFEIFNTKPVNLGIANIESLSPNPFSDHFVVNYTLDEDADISIQLYNMQGVMVADDRQRGTKGANTYRYEGGNALKPGNYILHLTAGGQQVTAKLVKY